MNTFIRVSSLAVTLNTVMWIIAIIAGIILTAKGSDPRRILPILFGGIAVAISIVASKRREDGGTQR